jgi:nicotinate-nucleotide adenylyltransferase
MNVGIIGGSFNPIHIAHLIIADRFVDQMELDMCYFVPAYRSPFKVGDNLLAPAEDRLAMVQNATQQHDKFRVSDVELERGGISYTIDTVQHFRDKYPGANVSLLIGSDQAVEFVRWKDWQEICRLAQLCIVRRPFLLTPEMEERMTDLLTVDDRAPVWIGAPLLEISSTDIRRRVREGKSINYLTVKSVRDHIERNGLYRAMPEHEWAGG